MLRISSRLNPHVASKVVRGRCGAPRLQSTYSSGPGGGSKALVATAAATTAVAGVVGYASWSNDNRKKVEGVIPGSSYVLGAVLGPVYEPRPIPPPPPIKDQGLARKKLDREKKRKALEEAAAPAPEPVAEPVPESVQAEEISVIEPTSVVEEASVVEESSVVEEASVVEESSVVQEASVVEESSVVQEASVEESPAPEVVVDATIPLEFQEEAKSDGGLKIIATPGQPKAEVTPEPAPEKGVSDLENRLAAGEMTEAVENASLTESLEVLAASARRNLTAALSVAEEAATVIRQHAEQAYHAIDAGQDKDLMFAAVAELSAKKAEMLRVAQAKIVEAEDAVEKLREQIHVGYTTGLTKENKNLIAAEEDLADLKYAVEGIRAIINESERDSKVINDYRNLVETGKQEFEAEVKSLLPEVKLGETSGSLTKDELNLLIAHAHRKVLHLQKQLAQSQTLEHDRFKEALGKQRDEDKRLMDAKLNAELDKQHQTLEVDHKRKIVELREELESELRAQLKRQAAAHSDHLADVLAVQEKELDSKWSEVMQEKVQGERDKYLTSVAGMKGQLDGLKTAMAARANVDKAAYTARELWLACESLRNALRLGQEGAKSWEDQLKPLSEHVTAIKKASGNNSYVDAVLGAIPEDAQSRGVYTEEALRERFMKVERICKRVSMIGDNGGSLLKYLLSYVQSFLVLSAFEYLPASEMRDEEMPVDSLSVYDILARAKYCLDKDDLMQSVRYMNLLRGEARNVASGWLQEARLTLEMRQAADALLAHAAAVAVKAM